jgi:hypothetical protein
MPQELFDADGRRWGQPRGPRSKIWNFMRNLHVVRALANSRKLLKWSYFCFKKAM